MQASFAYLIIRFDSIQIRANRMEIYETFSTLFFMVFKHACTSLIANSVKYTHKKVLVCFFSVHPFNFFCIIYSLTIEALNLEEYFKMTHYEFTITTTTIITIKRTTKYKKNSKIKLTNEVLIMLWLVCWLFFFSSMLKKSIKWLVTYQMGCCGQCRVDHRYNLTLMMKH